MANNLLPIAWTELDPLELRLVLNEHIRGPGQYDGHLDNPNSLYLPLAGDSCKLNLKFKERQIVAIYPGPAFQAEEWERIASDIEENVLVARMQVGREYSFSSFRVFGSWRGTRSGIQIVPPSSNAPRADMEIAEHPFILEFPIMSSGLLPIKYHRRRREHRKLTLVLNVLLVGRTSLQPRQSDGFWTYVSGHSQWVRRCFLAVPDEIVGEQLSETTGERIEEMSPSEYYRTGQDGGGLRVPNDLDELLFLYQYQLSPTDRDKFDRATFWMDMASRQWNISVSASFASLVSAIESLTPRGDIHEIQCPTCNMPMQHEVPGSVRRFRTFFERYAPEEALADKRKAMYGLRSDILHGSRLMQLDQDRAFGWDPPYLNERDLHSQLWGLTRIALRNWLRNPSVA